MRQIRRRSQIGQIARQICRCLRTLKLVCTCVTSRTANQALRELRIKHVAQFRRMRHGRRLARARTRGRLACPRREHRQPADGHAGCRRVSRNNRRRGPESLSSSAHVHARAHGAWALKLKTTNKLAYFGQMAHIWAPISRNWNLAKWNYLPNPHFAALPRWRKGTRASGSAFLVFAIFLLDKFLIEMGP